MAPLKLSSTLSEVTFRFNEITAKIEMVEAAD